MPPPVTPWTLSRDHLFDRLERRSVVLVLGAAGYGKSVLLSSWLGSRPPTGAVAWLGLGPAHEDPGRLAADLLTALRAPVAGSLQAALADLEAPPVFADDIAFVDSLLEGLFDAEIPVTLVLDDVHRLSGSTPALKVLDHFMAWAPPSTRVVLASRSTPQLRLQRLRMEDRLELIGHQDLAFTREDTAAALDAWGVQLGSAQVTDLHAQTQGWPAAIRLAALALGSGTPRDLRVDLHSDDALAAYLATEVLDTLVPEVQEFVVDATVDESVCPALLDQVRGATDSAAMLERCANAGLFLMREGGELADPWYRWHGLFAAHMRAHRLADAARAARLERRAAHWWREVDAAVAVTHALAAHDEELAGDIVASAWLDLVLAGRSDTVKRMASAIPDHVRAAPQRHLALAFVAAEQGDVDITRGQLAAARRVAHRLEGPDLALYETRASVIELFVVRDRSALSDALSRGHRMLEAAESGDIDIATLTLVRLHVGMSEARQGDHPRDAMRTLSLARSTAEVAGFTALELTARAEYCIPSIAAGRLDETRQIAEQVLAEANAKGWSDLPGTATAYGYLGWLALWRGDARRAVTLLERCIGNLLPNDWGMLALATTVHAQACLSAGDVGGAEQDTRSGRDLARIGQMPEWWPSLLTSLEARVLAERGHLEDARRLVEQPASGPEFHLATCFRAGVQLRAGCPDRALEIIDTLPPDRMFPHVAGMVEVLRAQALSESGEGRAAHAAMERALDVATSFAFFEPYRFVGPGILPLLVEHLRTGTAHRDHVTQVIHRLSVELEPAAGAWGETLTPRERSILGFLRTDLSNPEIAAAEFISINTVKTHIAHIFQKLDVTNRRAAVRRAIELGIL